MRWKFSLIVSILVKCFMVPGTTSIDDPCPSSIDKTKVATMCHNTTAEEDSIDGTISIDSVALRIMEQKSGCVCKIHFAYHVPPEIVFSLKKFDDRFTSAPKIANCGLEIDAEMITASGPVGTNEDPIRCLIGYDNRSFTALHQHNLKLTSRKTNGTFTNGYCLQIYRELNNATPSTLTINCFDHLVDKSTVETTPNDFSTDVQYSSDSTNTSISVTSDILEIRTGDPSTVYGSIQTSIDIQTDSEEEQLKLYIISGSSAAGGLFVFFVLVMIAYKCRKKKSKHDDSTLNQQPTTDNEDYDSYWLKDNLIYVSSDVQSDSIENQSTANTQVDVETVYVNSFSQKGESHEVFCETKPSNSEAPVGGGDETNEVEYAVVNKTPKLQVNHVTPEGTSYENAL